MPFTPLNLDDLRKPEAQNNSGGSDSIFKFSGSESSSAPKQVTPQSIISKMSGAYKGTSNNLGNFSEGFAKSGLNLARGAAGLLQAGGQRILGAITPGKTYEDIRRETGFKSLQNETPEGAGVRETLTPKGTAQKIGSFLGDTAQFAIPLSRVSKVGQVATEASRLQKTLGLGKKVLTEGAVSGGVATAQEGEINKEARDVAIISAAFPLAGKASKTIVQAFRNPNNGGRVINSLIKPLLKDLSYGKNPGRAIAEEGIVANNFDDLVQKVSAKKDQIGQQIELRLSTPEINKIKMDVSDLIAPLNQAQIQAMKAPRTNSAVISRIKDTIDDILGLSADAKGNPVMSRKLKDITPLEATEIKRLIGEITKFTGNQSDDKIVNKALKQAYGIVKGKIDEAVPGIKKLNEKYADLISAKIAAEYRDKILGRQDMVGFMNKLSSGIGAGTSIFTGNPIPALVGFGAAGVNKLLATPAFKTRFAQWLANAPLEQKRDLFQKAPWIKGMILQSINGQGRDQK